MSFSVDLNRPADSDVSVSYETADSTAVDGEDYIGISGQITFSAGETHKIFEVEIIGDNNYADEDGDESFSVILTNPNGAELSAASSASGFILNDDLTKREAYDGLKVLYNDEFLDQILFPMALAGTFSLDRLANIDLDNDGDLDIIAGTMLGEVLAEERIEYGSVYIFRNHVGKGFTREATDVVGFARDIEIADFNGDGLEDAYFAEFGLDQPPILPGETDFLMFQTAEGGLVDATDTHLPIIKDLAHGSCTGDFDSNNGNDVMTANGSVFKLMMNDGIGHFTNQFDTRLPLDAISWEYIVAQGLQNDLPEEEHDGLSSLQSYWCTTLDADQDGDIDIVLGAWALPDAINLWGQTISDRHILLFNDGSGYFTFEGEDSLIQRNPIGIPADQSAGPPTVTVMFADDFDGNGCDDFMAAISNNMDELITEFFYSDCAGGFTVAFADFEMGVYLRLSADYSSKEDINDDGVPEYSMNCIQCNGRLFEVNAGVVTARDIGDDDLYNLSPATFVQRARNLVINDRWPLP